MALPALSEVSIDEAKKLIHTLPDENTFFPGAIGPFDWIRAGILALIHIGDELTRIRAVAEQWQKWEGQKPL